MSEEQREKLLDLLTTKAIFGLDNAGQLELDELDPGTADDEFRSLEQAAAAICVAGNADFEPLPEHLFSKIVADYGSSHVVAEADAPLPPERNQVYGRDEIFAESPSKSWFGWLGWATAALACIALAINIGMTRFQNNEQAKIENPVVTPQAQNFEQQLEAFIRSTPNAIKAKWASVNPKDPNQVSGEVVWSDEKQAGYMRFRGLAVNDSRQTTYQLWIFDKTQDKATPIDGGTFDVSSDGDVIIPINAKLKAASPEMFAITVEKPGGVVVSKREKIAAIAKVETQTS